MALPKLKIALVCDHFLPRIGGIELQVRDLALHLARAGHEPHVFTTTPVEKGSQEDKNHPFKIHRLPARLLPGFKILYRPGDLKFLKEKLKQNQFDIIHSHMSVVSPLAFAALSLAHDLKIPAVLTAHSLLENSVVPFKFFYKLRGGTQWHWSPTAVSQAVAKGLKKIVGEHKVDILPNGIDLAEWSPKKQAHQGLHVISVLRLNKKKRADALLRQIPNVLSQVPKSQLIQFHLVGKGPYEKTLKKIAQRLNLQKYVCFHGYQDRKQIQELFRQSDLFVMPSKKESFGIALLEARAAGLPVVALSYGGPQDLIKPGQNGILADNDPKMGEAIIELLNNTEKRKQMAAQSRSGLEVYDWNQIIKSHEKVYQGLLNKVKV